MKESFVVGMQSIADKPYVVPILAASLKQTQQLTGVVVKEAYVDRGFRGHRLDLETLKVESPFYQG